MVKRKRKMTIYVDETTDEILKKLMEENIEIDSESRAFRYLVCECYGEINAREEQLRKKLNAMSLEQSVILVLASNIAKILNIENLESFLTSSQYHQAKELVERQMNSSQKNMNQQLTDEQILQNYFEIE